MNSYKQIMTDYRLSSNYSSSGVYEQKMKKNMGIKTNEDYRSYLTNNANILMNQNKTNALSANIEATFNNVNNSNKGPYLFYSIQDKSNPQGYEINETKQNYLSRVQLQDLKFNRYKTNVNV